jgi:hypothetical protein
MAMVQPAAPLPTGGSSLSLLSLSWDNVASSLDLSISWWILLALVVLFGAAALWRWWSGGFALRSFEIDQAEIGVGSSKFRFKPNLTDRQVAYDIWVELSTRKIGLPIDFEHDVVAEIYDSWFNFFKVTRELLKTVPVSQFQRPSTQAIVSLSIEVLNEGLRPHLTRWQARFRHWYDRELKRYDEEPSEDVMDPQQIQARFPQFGELRDDMRRVNQALIRYRSKMHELIQRI